VDAAYGDFCISQVAKALGHSDDAAMFLKRSQNWRNLFDTSTGFLRGKHKDGSWLEPFDEFRWGDPYVEGAAWQHRFDVPHDIPALIDALGGNVKAVDALDKMLSLPPTFHVGVYGQEIHEMSEMAAADFGQYDHGNQPVHHILYIYAMAGRPDRTQQAVHRVMEELYSPDSFAGDEDTGSMAAWYILSAMGFFPLCPAKPEYVLGKSLFPAMTVRLQNNKTLRIENHAGSGIAQSIALNGARIAGPVIPHQSLTAGGSLIFR
jgi:predicted alpha-1,2-mannosidase